MLLYEYKQINDWWDFSLRWGYVLFSLRKFFTTIWTITSNNRGNSPYNLEVLLLSLEYSQKIKIE